MTHGSLFSGIGGFDLAAEWMGWDNVFHCEWEDFPRKVLKHYWPKAISYGDITKTDFTIHRGRIDILTGGFPCQPYSSAGKRLGKEDDRHLWPEMLRAIREIAPTWVVGENVRGLVNWNGGMVFDEVQADLEAEGYEVLPFLLPACGVNAPHRRNRIWFVAHSNGRGSKRLQYELGEFEKSRQRGQNNEKDCHNDAADTECVRQQRPGRPKRQCDKEKAGDWKKYRVVDDGRWPTESPVRRRDDGFSEELDKITFSEWAKESIKAYGNAIVPQVVYQIFKAIEQYGRRR